MNDTLDLLFKISLAIFMAGSLLEMGLRLNLVAAYQGLRSPRFVFYTLLWSFVICPALAYGITLVIPLQPPYAIGLILLGMAPCAPFVPALVDKAKGDLGYTAAFMVLASVGTVVFMPFAVPLRPARALRDTDPSTAWLQRQHDLWRHALAHDEGDRGIEMTEGFLQR